MHSVFNIKMKRVLFLCLFIKWTVKNGLQKYRVRINFTDSSGKSKQIDRVAYGKETAKEFERQLAYNLSDETIKENNIATTI